MFRLIVLLFALSVSVQPAFGFDPIGTAITIAALSGDSEPVQEPVPNAFDVMPVLTNVDKNTGKYKYVTPGAIAFIIFIGMALVLNTKINQLNKAKKEPSCRLLTATIASILGAIICLFATVCSTEIMTEGKYQAYCVGAIKEKHFIDYQYDEAPRLVNIDIKTPPTHYDRPVNERLFEVTVEKLDGSRHEPTYYDCSWLSSSNIKVIERPSSFGLANYPH